MRTENEVVDVFPDVTALTKAAGEHFVLLAKDAVAARGVFTVALSGGSTPKVLYTLLATDQSLRGAIPWSNTHFFFGDERHVPPDHVESNFRMVNEAMFRRLAPISTRIHRVPAENPDAVNAAAQYEANMRELFGLKGLVRAGFPRFDLILLGMGPDGHTASLFPGTVALGETKRWVVANWVEKLKTHRITFTFPVLNNAAEVILFVAGPDKAPMVAEVLGRAGNVPRYPVQMVQPRNGVKRWMLDKPAASLLAPN